MPQRCRSVFFNGFDHVLALTMFLGCDGNVLALTFFWDLTVLLGCDNVLALTMFGSASIFWAVTTFWLKRSVGFNNKVLALTMLRL